MTRIARIRRRMDWPVVQTIGLRLYNCDQPWNGAAKRFRFTACSYTGSSRLSYSLNKGERSGSQRGWLERGDTTLQVILHTEPVIKQAKVSQKTRNSLSKCQVDTNLRNSGGSLEFVLAHQTCWMLNAFLFWGEQRPGVVAFLARRPARFPTAPQFQEV